MKEPPRQAAPSDEFADDVGRTPHSIPGHVAQASRLRSVADAKERTALYRFNLNRWYAGPPGVPMPQPADDAYGLALAPSSSSAILWKRGGS